MRTAKKIFCTFMIAALMLLIMGTSVFAIEEGSAWLQVDTSEENVTLVAIVANTPVTDGLITLTYDAADLRYVGLEANSDCVAYNSVNADEAGLIKLAWVGSGEYEADGAVLFTLTFNGVSETEIVMSGQMTDTEGNPLIITETLQGADFSELKKAVFLARGLSAENYTAESFAAMEAVLASAETLLANKFALQEDVDAAALALNEAIDHLELVGDCIDTKIYVLEKAILKARAVDQSLYTAESYARLEEALEYALTLEVEVNTSEEYQAAADALNAAIYGLELNPDAPATGGFLAAPVILLMVLSAAGVVATVTLLLRKKGRCAK